VHLDQVDVGEGEAPHGVERLALESLAAVAAEREQELS
jgi:hypothetical protein